MDPLGLQYFHTQKMNHIIFPKTPFPGKPSQLGMYIYKYTHVPMRRELRRPPLQISSYPTQPDSKAPVDVNGPLVVEPTRNPQPDWRWGLTN